jgi:four helix bundle protein
MEIFVISKQFPKEETYSLTDQIRRSSRSVCICLLEAYRKKRYLAHFVAKVTDSDMENSETSGWLDFSLACRYIASEKHVQLSEQKCRNRKVVKSHDKQSGKILILQNTGLNCLLLIVYCLLCIVY